MWLEHAETSLWKQPFDSVLNVLLNRLHVYSVYDVYVSTFTHVVYIYINIFKSPYNSRDQDGRPQTILESIFINIYVYKTIFLSWFLVLKDWCRFHLPFRRSFEVQNKKSHKRSQTMPNAILYMNFFQKKKTHQVQFCTETLDSSTPLDITQMGLDEPLCTYRKVVPENTCANGWPTQNKSQENWLQNQIWSTHSCTRRRHGFPGGVLRQHRPKIAFLVSKHIYSTPKQQLHFHAHCQRPSFPKRLPPYIQYFLDRYIRRYEVSMSLTATKTASKTAPKEPTVAPSTSVMRSKKPSYAIACFPQYGVKWFDKTKYDTR